MGNCNCFVRQEKVIKVMKTNGQILEYRSPLKVEDLLLNHAGHVVSDQLPVVHHLRPDTEMIAGNLYYLLPARPLPESGEDEAEGQKGKVVRIKVVVKKQELQLMLTKGEFLSIDDLDSIANLGKKQSMDDEDDDSFRQNCRGWKPVLASIPEIN